jgi:hypothetical protein
MLSDKINGLPISRVDSPAISRVDPPPIGRVDFPQVSRVEPPPINRIQAPPISSFEDQNAATLVNKQGNILSFDNSRRNSSPLVDRDRSEISTPPVAPPTAKPVTYNPTNTAPRNTSTANTSDELEKRRAELAAMARAAEARLKEVEEQCEQAEGRLEQELRERLLAEQRLRELEENRLRQQQAIMIEAPQARTSAWAQGGSGAGTGTWVIEPEAKAKEFTEAKAKEFTDAKAKEIEARAKDAEAEVQALMVALMEAEQKRVKAEALAQTATDKARELESEAETAKAALAEANRRMAEAEAAARVAEENVRAIESLIVEAEAAGRQATERYQHIEAELQYEAKQRAVAEQKLKEFEDELSSYLELDWSKGEPDLSRAVVVRQGGADEVVSQFHAQVEAERRARREAEEARAALEHRTREMERALRIAEENNRQIAALNLSSSVDDDQPYTVKKRKGFKYELKFIGYGIAIALLLVLLIAIVATVFLQT